jgi:hypothetical protein
MTIPDEEQPLLRQITEDDTKHDEVILDFEPLDPEDPRNWSDAFKWCIVLLLASMAFTVYVLTLIHDFSIVDPCHPNLLQNCVFFAIPRIHCSIFTLHVICACVS